jgi:hypothetical protein
MSQKAARRSLFYSRPSIRTNPLLRRETFVTRFTSKGEKVLDLNSRFKRRARGEETKTEKPENLHQGREGSKGGGFYLYGLCVLANKRKQKRATSHHGRSKSRPISIEVFLRSPAWERRDLNPAAPTAGYDSRSRRGLHLGFTIHNIVTADSDFLVSFGKNLNLSRPSHFFPLFYRKRKCREFLIHLQEIFPDHS